MFYRRHLSPIDPPLESSARAAAGANGTIYQTMWGPSEFVITGNLNGYERTDRLSEITVPTLLTCGRHDLATPEAAIWYQQHMPNAEVVIFEASAHGPHDEEPDRYRQVLRDFLRRV